MLILRQKYKRFKSLREKLLALTDRRGPDECGPDECWLWAGTVYRGAAKRNAARGWRPVGYGRVTLGQWSDSAHRATYREFVGTIPEDFTIDHTCFNGLCQNPRHLEAVPQHENSRRYIVKHWTERRGRPPLSADDVVEIKALSAAGVKQAVLAAKFGIDQSRISRLVTGHTKAYPRRKKVAA